ncbi:carbon-nitrogen hydrolase family protein [Flavivirga abyssicola]|uniref:carbon-nitrogen hydrolase family protein n=1 Tax=Flavivirga abyssicola TaxID=3063533 RepID=UPI0026E0C041|nr:carbon-nitrogen hydrolase family protein [Flavivirga sp. MEBiC07777]WVK11696.1 carbon-nitrogen hydrolase family protein [Flavivirga sp. MEBiC07777]
MENSSYKVAAVQAAPVFLNLNASIDKAIKLIEEASNNGAKLVTFGECWLPGYPWWIWLDAPAMGMQHVQPYFENSMEIGSEQHMRLCEAARRNNIYVGMGFSERDGGSLYIAQLLIDDEGETISARRKLKPTHVERTVFGNGDGSDLKVHDTRIGKLGALACWEHLQPLSKYAMYSQNEQVHFAAWPGFSLYEGKAFALGYQVNTAASRIYAVEGSCYVVAPTPLITQEIHDMLCDTDLKKDFLPLGGGYARIYGPDGSELAEPIPHDQEGILYADIDLGAIAVAKAAADPAGHYARPDVTQLLFNPKPQRPVVLREAYNAGKEAKTEEVLKEEITEQS